MVVMMMMMGPPLLFQHQKTRQVHRGLPHSTKMQKNELKIAQEKFIFVSDRFMLYTQTEMRALHDMIPIKGINSYTSIHEW